MSEFIPRDLGFLPIRLLGGPLDGQAYGDLPVMPNGQAPLTLSVPLGEPSPGREHARYRSGQFDPETEMLLFEFVGIEIPGSAHASAGTDASAGVGSSDEDETEENLHQPRWEPASRFVIEQSWWIASELCRRNEHLRVYEMHPGGGMYDVLRVFDSRLAELVGRGEEQVVDLNRAGRIHLHNVDGYEPLDWRQVVAAESPHSIVRTIEDLRGWSVDKSPPTTPTSLVYRVISGLLTRKINDRERWDARSVLLDTAAQSGGGVREAFAQAFPVLVPLSRELRESFPSEVLLPESHLWVLQRANEALLLFDDRGFAHSRQGTRFDLMSIYRRTNSLDEVIGSLST